MTAVPTAPIVLRSPDQLAGLMGIPFSAQQLEAIAAPLEPGVIVAGAGSGKTTVMAARVVWLVGTGAVAADQILGLTFTNKAASELGQRVRKALADTGLLRRTTAVPDAAPGESDEPEIAEPTVLTYHAYASRLLTEHGLRIGHEPDTTVIADATRFQLAARVLREHTGSIDHLTTWLPTNVNFLLQLDAQLAEHLVTSDDVRRFHAGEIDAWRDHGEADPRHQEGRHGDAAARRAARPRRRLPGAEEAARRDGLLRPDGVGGAAGRGAARGRTGRA